MNVYKVNTNNKQGDPVTYKITALSIQDAVQRLDKRKCHGETTIERYSVRQSNRVPKKHKLIIEE
ncbi:MAG: hypothetical protein MJZ37_08505 [Bacilli bacterium]|nr:hypothetical protein [Bacilli bacterium]